MTLASVIAATQSANLQGYWKCDETSGTTLADSSGNSKDLSLTGGYTLNQSGQVGASVSFNGSTGYASRTDSVLGATAPSEWTIFALVNGAAQASRRIVAFGSSTDNDPIVNIQTNSTGAAAIGFSRRDTGANDYLNGGGTAFDSNWHAVVFRRKGGDFSVLVDGGSAHTATATLNTTTLDRTAIGALLRGSAGSFFSGRIQHVAVWNTGLTDAELIDIHSETGLDFAGVVLSEHCGMGGVSDDGFSYRSRLSAPALLQIEYSQNSDLSSSTTSAGVNVVSGDDYTGGETISGLDANTTYYYSINANGERQHSSPFPAVKTFPTAGVNAEFSVVFGSCQTNGNNATIFAAMAAENPLFHLHLGDLHYTDSTVVASLRLGYQAAFNSVSSDDFVDNIVNAMGVERVWDDHDGAGNNWNGDTANKANVLQVWEEYTPHHTLENGSNGIWRSFICGGCEFFILDTRYQKDGSLARFPAASTNTADTGSSGDTLVLRAADSPSAVNDFYNGHYVSVEGVWRRVTDYVAATRTCTLSATVAGLDDASTYFLRRGSILDQDNLGATSQIAWLIDGINNSSALWKVICSSIAWNPTVDQSDDDDVWGDWDSELAESNYLRQEITADNVIVLSGDRHWAAIDDGTNSHWPEATASPINRTTYLSGVAGTWTQGSENDELHYGLLEVITSGTELRLTIRDASGVTVAGITPLVVEAVLPPEGDLPALDEGMLRGGLGYLSGGLA